MRLIRASEVGEYVYCARAWWLHHVLAWQPDKLTQAQLMQGTRQHARHARTVAASGILLRLGVGLVLAALGLLGWVWIAA
ncbi:MAG: hypothetical protein HC911_10095 [Chloroflexaceae bacterium]|nr:hypothetical protein [Chloroflexaceae bacterium]